MSKAADLTDAIVACLNEITPSAGYHTDIKAVYGAGENKPDKAPMPCLLLRIESDEGDERVGITVKRAATFVIDGIFSRSASLQEMQRCHHDILKALGYGEVPQRRPLAPGWVGEESAEFDMAEEGGTHRRVTASISFQYVERY